MLAKCQISAEEDERLLELVGEPVESTKPEIRKAKYLRLSINPPRGCNGNSEVEKVNVRVPLALIRSGVKFTSLIPKEAADKVDAALREKGISYNIKNLKDEDIEQLIAALSDLEVDIDDGKGKIKVYLE